MGGILNSHVIIVYLAKNKFEHITIQCNILIDINFGTISLFQSLCRKRIGRGEYYGQLQWDPE